MQKRRVLIVSAESDLHAIIIQDALRKLPDTLCDILSSDRIAGAGVLNWSTDRIRVCASLPIAGGKQVGARDIDVIWWRRAGYPQQVPQGISNPAHIDLINNDCRVALAGVLLNEFRGTWINHPVNTQVAGNKLVQLRAAQQAGFRVPDTLVSQAPSDVRRFCRSRKGKVIVKAVSGTTEAQLITRMVTEGLLASPDAIKLCPAIYQEYIPGRRHLRVQCFGQTFQTVMITSRRLDWRTNLNVPLREVGLSTETRDMLTAVLRELGLKMGVVDLKLTPDGEVVWLEINPQGQFLFLEGLTGVGLTAAFAQFLFEEAGAARALR